MVADRINSTLQPFSNNKIGCSIGKFDAWAGIQKHDVSGDAGPVSYDGDVKSTMLGMQYCSGFGLIGLAIGEGETNLDTSANSGVSSLDGTIYAPYVAIPILDGQGFIDAMALYQELDGSSLNSTLVAPMTFDGDREAYRISGHYFLPLDDSFTIGFTAGGAYMNDDISGAYLGTTNSYGYEKGILFAGANLNYQYGLGRLSGGFTYYDDVTSSVDKSANVLNNGTEQYVNIEISGEWELAKNFSLGLNANTTVLDDGADSAGGGAMMKYQF